MKEKIKKVFSASILVGILFPLFSFAQTFDKDLYFGLSNDPDVLKLQEFLTSENLYSGPITGNFFSLTLEAVKNFQKKEDITPVGGYFGPKTRAKANGILNSQIQASNKQTLKETGKAPVPSPIPQPSNVVSSLQNQILVLQQRIALLLQQFKSLPTTTPQSQTSTLTSVCKNDDSSCGSTFCVNCNSLNSWSDIESSYSCSDERNNCMCQKQEYHSYRCSGTFCIESVTDTKILRYNCISTSISIPTPGPLIISNNFAIVEIGNAGEFPQFAVVPVSEFPVFRFIVTVKNNDAIIQGIKFREIGTANTASFANLKLVIDNNEIATITDLTNDSYGRFDINHRLSVGTHEVKLLSDIIPWGNHLRNFSFRITTREDVIFKDAELDLSILPIGNFPIRSEQGPAHITICDILSAGGEERYKLECP